MRLPDHKMRIFHESCPRTRAPAIPPVRAATPGAPLVVTGSVR